ncbi:haloacid dehalogenase-like hydrolase domain-containing protein [Ditylenchus destructor]|uniref:Haloacid dehalogenase-like hydrolase domain-containing protein n=1 Tax=Ditylenchus destructor TaxID=166010 RepID=A0AAD4NCW3_9BILA|nr:haloacid dehalogenase-like hydrolase domain-containing protein [Ditylenchus destructor]
MHLYCKGAPEMIASLCLPGTVPSDYQTHVDNYARHGYRLIAVASRELEMNYVKAQKIKRELIECDLTLLGLIVMENRLKPQTVGVIAQLNKADIRTVMITGDNLLTAMSVARECGIIRPHKRAFLLEAIDKLRSRDGRTYLSLKQSVSSSHDLIEVDDISDSIDMIEPNKVADSTYHIAISGPTLRVICDEYPEMLEQLVCVCDVYARMSPDQKQMLVNKLQEVDYTVVMCGDGANDCAALKAAHAGISLSEAEASIAAPFTSKVADIRCVPTVIREGRAALVTSFGVFKYMAGYSLTQFISIMQLYWLNTNMTDIQFLYIDLALVTLVSMFFGYTPACERLSRNPPPTRLLSVASMLSIIGQLLIIGFFQVFTFIYTAYQPWFIPYAMPVGDETEDRRSMQGNKPLCLSLIGLTLLSALITVQPPEFLSRFLEYDPIPYIEDRLFLLILGLMSGALSYIYEVFFIQHLIIDVREKAKKRKALSTGSKETNRFERILLKVGAEPYWIKAKSGGGSFSMPIPATPILQPTTNGNVLTVAPADSSRLRGDSPIISIVVNEEQQSNASNEAIQMRPTGGEVVDFS